MLSPATAPARPEISVGAGKLFPRYGDSVTDDLDDGNLDVRVTLPYTPRFAFEFTATMGRRGTQFLQRTEGLYLLQVKQRLRRLEQGGFQPFLTYGVAG